jgi:inosose dehydratase
VWSETFGEGDIDYRPLATVLRDLRFAGPLIMEQCGEKGTPAELVPVERERRSRQWVREVFGA